VLLVLIFVDQVPLTPSFFYQFLLVLFIFLQTLLPQV
jgi:hypothetical protein